jgi:hypothetical protein
MGSRLPTQIGLFGTISGYDPETNGYNPVTLPSAYLAMTGE